VKGKIPSQEIKETEVRSRNSEERIMRLKVEG